MKALISRKISKGINFQLNEKLTKSDLLKIIGGEDPKVPPPPPPPPPPGKG